MNIALEAGYFVRGLKHVIDESGMTQEEFAKGVTSKVNLSNVLRGASGTSTKMREAMARKAGMSIEEVVALGKQLTLTTGVRTSSGPVEGEEADSGRIQEMGAVEMAAYIDDTHTEMVDAFSTYIKRMKEAVTTLAKQRETLISMLHTEQSTLNAIGEEIKVVDRNLKIVSCNRAVTELRQQVKGDDCCNADCAYDKGEGCIAKKAFVSGKVERLARRKMDGSIESCAAYPIYSHSNTVEHVAVVIRNGSQWAKEFRDLGIEMA